MLSIFGNKFLKQETTVDESAFQNLELIGLYFSALWCYPCRKFTPMLSDFYEKVNEQKKKFEIFFVSKDKDQNEFLHYYKHMPFLALPFDDKQRLGMLFNFYRVQGIPTLVVLDGKGRYITKDGKSYIESMGIEAYDQFLQMKEEMYSDVNNKE